MSTRARHRPWFREPLALPRYEPPSTADDRTPITWLGGDDKPVVQDMRAEPLRFEVSDAVWDDFHEEFRAARIRLGIA